jgi:hypothetical protein
MRASEIINDLHKLIEKYGDKEVDFVAEGNGIEMNIEFTRINQTNGRIELRGSDLYIDE